MGRDEKDPLDVAAAKQARAQERTAAHIEWRGRLLRDCRVQLVQCGASRIIHGQRNGCGSVNHLSRQPIHRRKTRAQHLVSSDDARERGRERVGAQCSGET